MSTTSLQARSISALYLPILIMCNWDIKHMQEESMLISERHLVLVKVVFQTLYTKKEETDSFKTAVWKFWDSCLKIPSTRIIAISTCKEPNKNCVLHLQDKNDNNHSVSVNYHWFWLHLEVVRRILSCFKHLVSVIAGELESYVREGEIKPLALRSTAVECKH